MCCNDRSNENNSNKNGVYNTLGFTTTWHSDVNGALDSFLSVLEASCVKKWVGRGSLASVRDKCCFKQQKTVALFAR